MDYKPITRAKPFVVNKNMGSPERLTPDDFTSRNADGLPVVRPTEKQKHDFDRTGWLLIPGVLEQNELEEMREFGERPRTAVIRGWMRRTIELQLQHCSIR